MRAGDWHPGLYVQSMITAAVVRSSLQSFSIAAYPRRQRFGRTGIRNPHVHLPPRSVPHHARQLSDARYVSVEVPRFAVGARNAGEIIEMMNERIMGVTSPDSSSPIGSAGAFPASRDRRVISQEINVGLVADEGADHIDKWRSPAPAGRRELRSCPADGLVPRRDVLIPEL